MCQHPTPTHTPSFHLMKKPVWWAEVGPVKGPVIQVWGLEGRCESNQLDAPTPSLSFHSWGALSWSWVHIFLLREEEQGEMVR